MKALNTVVPGVYDSGAMFAFFYHWNEFIGPLMYLPLQCTFPISIGISSFLSEQTTNDALMTMAPSMTRILSLVRFFAAQPIVI